MGNKGGQGGRVWGSVSKRSSFRSSAFFIVLIYIYIYIYIYTHILLGSFFQLFL